MKDPIDTAQVALDRVAGIAIGLGCKQGRLLCAELGIELWLVYDHLRTRQDPLGKTVFIS